MSVLKLRRTIIDGGGKIPWRVNVLLIKNGPQSIGIECAVGEQMIGADIFDQVRHGAQVMRLPGHQPEIDGVAQAVGQRQYPGGDTAARAPYGLAESPPLAPRPERRTLTMEPSIIAYSRSGSEDNALSIL